MILFFPHYGDEANEFQKFWWEAQEYGAHRYNTTVDRNAGRGQDNGQDKEKIW